MIWRKNVDCTYEFSVQMHLTVSLVLLFYRGAVGRSVLQDIYYGWRTRGCGKSTDRPGRQPLVGTPGMYLHPTQYTHNVHTLFTDKK